MCRQRINGIVLMPYDLFSWNKHDVNSALQIIYINYIFFILEKIAHSVHADPSSSRPSCPFLLFLLHVVCALAEHRLLIFLASWGAGPSLAPLHQAEPISPQVPGNAPLPCWAQIIRQLQLCHCFQKECVTLFVMNNWKISKTYWAAGTNHVVKLNETKQDCRKRWRWIVC